MDEFYFSCIVCISTLIREKQMGENCALVLELTEAVLGHELDMSHEQLSADFNNFIEQTHATFGSEYNEAEDNVQNYLTKRVQRFLKDKYNLTEYPHMSLVEGGWQVVDAPWVWTWIHVVTVYIDLNNGIDEKTFFIGLVENLIGCSLCKNHYVRNKTTIFTGLTHFSLTDLFLMLHTQTKINFGSAPTQLDHKYINHVYKKRFQNNYNSLS